MRPRFVQRSAYVAGEIASTVYGIDVASRKVLAAGRDGSVSAIDIVTTISID